MKRTSANTVDKFERPKSTAKRIQAQDTRDCGHMFCSKEHAQWATSSFSNRFAFPCGHQKRFTKGNVWTWINLKTDKYLSVFKFNPINSSLIVYLVKFFL